MNGAIAKTGAVLAVLLVSALVYLKLNHAPQIVGSPVESAPVAIPQPKVTPIAVAPKPTTIVEATKVSPAPKPKVVLKRAATELKNADQAMPPETQSLVKKMNDHRGAAVEVAQQNMAAAEVRIQEDLKTEQSARALLKKVSGCVDLAENASMPKLTPAQIVEPCLAVGRRAVSAYPNLQAEFDKEVMAKANALTPAAH